METPKYTLEKWEWTESDFDIMGWHDCPIYAMRFDDDIYFDIDYILRWNNHGAAQSFTFWIAPATLIFKNPESFIIDVGSDFVNGLEIHAILKEENNNQTKWRIQTQEGEIIIVAEKYSQIIRRPPSFQYSLSIPDDERGEVSFSTVSDKHYQPSTEIITRKQEDFEIYKLALARDSLKFELENIDKDNLVTKERLLKKRSLDEEINAINKRLTDTRFDRW